MSQLKQSDIEAIIRQFEAGELATMEVRVGDSELFLSRNPGERPSWSGQVAIPHEAAAVPAGSRRNPPPTVVTPPTAADISTPPGHVIVPAPSMGTFYRAEKPGAPAFVEVGHSVTADSELCLIEVMKLFTTLRAGVRGKVTRILVGDGTPIERGQPLFIVDTNA